MLDSKLDPVFDAAAAEWDVDPNILRAVAMQESAGNSRAVSKKGARGLMGIMPETGRGLGMTNLDDDVQSIFAGAKYLAEARDAEADPADALRYYHGGPNWRNAYGPESQGYVPAVSAHYQRFAAAAPKTATDAGGGKLAAKDDGEESDADFLARTAGKPEAGGEVESDADFLARTGAKPAEQAAEKPAEAEPQGVAKNIAAGTVEGTGAAMNVIADPFGNLVGKPLATLAVTAHDALAPVFGYERFPDAVRNQLLGDTVPQPGTRAIAGIGGVVGVQPGDVVPATPIEQAARTASQGAAAGGVLMGIPGAVAGGTGALGGEAAASYVPEWLKPAAELGGNLLMGGLSVPAMMAGRLGLGSAADAVNRFAAGAEAPRAAPTPSRLDQRLALAGRGGVAEPGAGPAPALEMAPGGPQPGMGAPVAGAGAQQAQPGMGARAGSVEAEAAANGWRPMQPGEAIAPGQEIATDAQGRQWVRMDAGAPPNSVGAMGTPGNLGAMTPAEVTANRSQALVNKLHEPQPAGQRDATTYVPGDDPTMVQAEQTVNAARELKDLRNMNTAVDQQARDVAAQQQEARVRYLNDTLGSVQEVQNMRAVRDAKMAERVGENGTVWRGKQDADAQPVVDLGDAILRGPDGKRSAVEREVDGVLSRLRKRGSDDLETDPEILYGVRKHINDRLSKEAAMDDPMVVRVRANLLALREVLDQRIEAAAPGFRQAINDFATESRPIDALEALQNAEKGLYGSDGRLQFSKVQRLMREITYANHPDAPLNPWQSLTDDQIGRLFNLRDTMRRAASADDLARARGSDTAQNLVGIMKEYTKIGAGGVLHATPGVGHIVRGIQVGLEPILSVKRQRDQVTRGNRLLSPPEDVNRMGLSP